MHVQFEIAPKTTSSPGASRYSKWRTAGKRMGHAACGSTSLPSAILNMAKTPGTRMARNSTRSTSRKDPFGYIWKPKKITGTHHVRKRSPSSNATRFRFGFENEVQVEESTNDRSSQVCLQLKQLIEKSLQTIQAWPVNRFPRGL